MGNKSGRSSHQDLGTTAPGAWLPCGVRWQPVRYTAAHWLPTAIYVLFFFFFFKSFIPVCPHLTLITHGHTQSLHKTKNFLLLNSWRCRCSTRTCRLNVLLDHWRKLVHHKELSGVEKGEPSLGGFAATPWDEEEASLNQQTPFVEHPCGCGCFVYRPPHI